MPTATATRGKRLPADERRALVEEAAVRLFAERGYVGTTLDDIAAAAHVTKPIVYRHFGSKKELYLALLKGHYEGLPAATQAWTVGGTLATRLPELIDAWFAFFEAHPHTWVLIFRDPGGDEEIQAARREAQARARALIASIIEARPEFSIPEAEVHPTAELIRNAMAGLALWWLDHPDVPRSVLVASTSRAIAGLIQPTA